ncbi:MAG: GNAT family N-acetyltransferase [Clostridia bacterium]|nr:GNAT family N-acetyltransferase [Clostridia bacterium]
MILYTSRLILRPWEDSDAEDLYRYAKDPLVGPAAGWPPHTSVENSLDVIRNVLRPEGALAVCLKSNNLAIGSVGLMIGKESNLGLPEDEAEVGYWLGVPFWGKGLIPEAVREICRYGLDELHLRNIWCAYFDGNEKSRRVQEKCGFVYHHTNADIPWPLMNRTYTEHVTLLDRDKLKGMPQ